MICAADCETEFVPKRSSQKYCSRKCQRRENKKRENNRRDGLKPALTMLCAYGCGVEFAPKRASQKYCSPKCQNKHKTQRVRTARGRGKKPRPCACNCGEMIPASASLSRIYLNRKHKDNAYKVKQPLNTGRKPKRSDFNTQNDRRTCAETEADRNAADILDKIERFNAGTLPAIYLRRT